jgi:2-polyprenyl-3-methyl-5-hydroxy-6-metoxy-1,4-benzoquinol methylase
MSAGRASSDVSKAKDYKAMWQTFAEKKAQGYLMDKFNPRHGIGFRNLLRHKMLLGALALSPADSVLDAGCASGYQVLEVSQLAYLVVGVDLGPEFVRTAYGVALERGITNAHFQVCSVEALAFKSASFSRVLCAEVLEHVLQPADTLAELKRVLKRGGLLVMSVPNENGDGTWWRRLKSLVTGQRFQPLESFSMESIARHGDAHVRKFDRGSLRRFLEAHGLRVQWMKGCGILDFPLYDRILNRVNRLALIRRFLFRVELFLGHLPWLVWLSRHLIVVAELDGVGGQVGE